VQFFEVDSPAASAQKRKLLIQLLPDLKKVRCCRLLKPETKRQACHWRCVPAALLHG